jgi:lysophospholipase L1-like esterase
MPQLVEPGNLPPGPFNASSAVLADSTLRQTMHVSVPGSTHRVRISNVFGTTPLALTAVRLHLPTNNSAGVSSIVPGSTRSVTFSGNSNYSIPTGAYIISDPINLSVKAASNVAISIYLQQGILTDGSPSGVKVTGHPGSRTTSWLQPGNHVIDGNLTGEGVASTAHWYLISSFETLSSSSSSGIAIVGDSITDGRGSTTDANNRWPDQLLTRLQSATSTRNIAILNQAAGGNRVLADGLGPNALSRIDRDVLAQSGVKYAMVFEGVNDIGTAGTDSTSQKVAGDQLIAAFKQIIERCHAQGLPVFGATITPFSAPANSTVQPYSDPERERTRQRVNQWIRSGFDAVVDFDKAVRDPKAQNMLADEYNSGDYLHLNPKGYQVMAGAVDLNLFSKFAGGVWA